MTVPRKQLIDLQSTPYYHVMNRCVRHAFLCGKDRYSGQCYEHRRQWIINKARALSQVFAIDICAYAIMSNHYHLVLRVNKEQAGKWSAREVVYRWSQVYRGPGIVQDFLALKPQSATELYIINELASRWRERLHDISWFMRSLNESIARQANAEDQCKGRFWQGRFKSQALLDEGALLTCMMYVDLNPIRAGVADSLEKSNYTSIQERINEVAKTMSQARKQLAKRKNGMTSANKFRPLKSHQQVKRKCIEKPESIKNTKSLLHFIGSEHIDRHPGIPYNLIDYFTLIEWTGRAVRADKKGAIPQHVQTLLHRLTINEEAWVDAVCQFEQRFGIAIGAAAALKLFSHNLATQWLRGKRTIHNLYRQTQTQVA